MDRSGAIVGLNALRRDGGLILAWPATVLRERAAALAAGTSTAPRRIGVALLGARQTRRMRSAVGLPDESGLLVRAVQDGSPAATAGVAAATSSSPRAVRPSSGSTTSTPRSTRRGPPRCRSSSCAAPSGTPSR